MIQIKFQSPLCYSLLDTFAVRSIAGESRAPLALVDEAADLISGTSGVFLAGTESVHVGRTKRTSSSRVTLKRRTVEERSCHDQSSTKRESLPLLW